MEKSLEELDREIENELNQICELTNNETESMDRIKLKLDRLDRKTTFKIENELIKSEYYAKVSAILFAGMFQSNRKKRAGWNFTVQGL